MENKIKIQEKLEVSESLSDILADKKVKSYSDDIWQLVLEKKLTEESLRATLLNYKINKIHEIKEDLMNIVLRFISHSITIHGKSLPQGEINHVKYVKWVFALADNDLYKHRRDAIGEILQPELEKMYINLLHNKTQNYEVKVQNSMNDPWSGWDSQESLYKVKLQEVFGLSHAQFLEFANVEDKKAIEKGANLIDLDTVYFK